MEFEPSDIMDQNFIDWAVKELGGKIAITKEPHGDQSDVYNLAGPNGSYFLKIASELAKERDRLEWLDGKLPVPKVIGFTRIENRDALLLSAIEGANLAKLKERWATDKIINKLAEALRQFHATSTANCSFGNPGPGKVLVHGDACLPNFIFMDDRFSGYIDLGDMRIDIPDVDISAAVWSLQYNLGPGYGLEFLKRYGVENASDDMVKKLISQYEDAQKEWGLA